MICVTPIKRTYRFAHSARKKYMYGMSHWGRILSHAPRCSEKSFLCVKGRNSQTLPHVHVVFFTLFPDASGARLTSSSHLITSIRDAVNPNLGIYGIPFLGPQEKRSSDKMSIH